MNLFLNFLTGGRVTYAPGCDDMWYLEIGGMLFAVFVVAIPTLVLRCLFQETTRPRTKLILSGFMVLVYIATVIGLVSVRPRPHRQCLERLAHRLPGRHRLDCADGRHHLVLPSQTPAQRK